MHWIYEPWPWYVAGPLFALIMLILLLLGKKFGMSSNLRTACSAAGAGKVAKYFDFDWKADRWNLMVVLGAMIGGFIASNYMGNSAVEINPETAQQLASDYHIESAGQSYLPPELFSIDKLGDPLVTTILFLGGLLVGFGARYAGGCTSGHGISGLSNLQGPSLLAVLGFFIGGVLMIHLFYPLIF